MHAPVFWKHKYLMSYLLLPLSWLYWLASKIRNTVVKPGKVNIPVICIGNVVVGGSGKTPIALAIGKMLKKKGLKPAYLSRGYGRRTKEVIKVDRKIHTCLDVGDEPLLLASVADTFVSKNRFEGAKKIAFDKKKFDVIIMDDGLQNPQLKKDLSILIVDGHYGFGNKNIMPAGPLRETINSAISKCKLAIIIGEDKNNSGKEFKNKLPVIKADVVTKNGKKFKNKKVIAFAGIGRPKKFFDSLEQAGAKLFDKISFPDHHFYKERELEIIIEMAKKFKLGLVTTEKDWIRLPEKLRKKIDFLEIDVEFNNLKELEKALSLVINKK